MRSQYYEELRKENEEIPDVENLIEPKCSLKKFKELHRDISNFILEEIVDEVDKTKEDIIEKRPADSEEITEKISLAEYLIAKYEWFQDQDYPLKKEKVEAHVEKMRFVLEQYKEELPRLITENYEAFKRYSKKARKARNKPSEYRNMIKEKTRFAKEFKNYFEAGKKYGISVFSWGEESKINGVREYLGEMESSENMDKDKKAEKITKVKEEINPRKTPQYLNIMAVIDNGKDEKFEMDFKESDKDIIDRVPAKGKSYFSLDAYLFLAGDNNRYENLKEIAKEVAEPIKTLKKLSNEIKSMNFYKRLAEDQEDFDYIRLFYHGIKETLKRGHMRSLVVKSNESLIKELMNNFEDYIEKSREYIKKELVKEN